MSEGMRKLDRAVRGRRKLVLGLWLLVVLAALPFAARQSEHLTTGGFRVPGSGSQEVDQLLKQKFPDYDRSPLAAVVEPLPGATRAQVAAVRKRLVDVVRKRPEVRLADAPVSAGRADAGRADAGRADGGRAGSGRAGAGRPDARVDRPIVIPLRTGKGDDENIEIALDLRKDLAINDDQSGPVRLHLVGYGGLWSGMNETSKRDLAHAEALGFPIVALILLTVFGSLAAAALPLAFGVVSVLVTGAIIFFLSQAMSMSVFATNMASMIGIGVAVDYSLFVLARYREEIHAGRSADEARAKAMSTSGVAVLFSGLTVILSLAGLWLIPNSAMHSMALGAMIVVAVSMLTTATLLPALLARFGVRVVKPGMLTLIARRRRRRRRERGFWTNWTEAVMRRPVLAVAVTGALLLAMAAPVLDMKVGIGATEQFPEGSETLAGLAAASEVAEPGAATPLQVGVRSTRGPVNRATLAEIRRRLAADPNVSRVERPRVSADRRSALVAAIPKADGEDPKTGALVDRMRATLPAAAKAGERVDVGGSSARLRDIKHLIDTNLWKVALFVLGLSFLVLLVLLRSVVLPLKAVVMNLLSVGVAYGVLIAVFQWGWVDGLFGFQSDGYVDWFTPPLVLAVVFGLSMDYEVFLLSRIRERYAATGDTTRAVCEGLASSARTITSAAIIMVAVYAVFIGTGVTSIKQIGLGTAVAIAVDATLVRLILMPAAMQLFGSWNWWLPRPLERILPRGIHGEEPAFEPVPFQPAEDRERVAV